MQKFKVNDYIKLKLEDNKTNIYINEEMFKQCKYLLLNISYNDVVSLDEIDSIDKAVETLGHSLELNKRNIIKIPPEVEFWGHCSNLQVWVENNYDTRLLLSNLAFPLLKKLTEVGDPIARKVFKDEIIKRILSYELNVIRFLIGEGYFKYFDSKEIEILLDEIGEGIDKMPIENAIRYLDIIARRNIEDRLLIKHINTFANRIEKLSNEQVLDLLNKNFGFTFGNSNFCRLLLENTNLSKILYDSLTSKQYDLRNKTIHFLRCIGETGINYLIKWFPFAVRKFDTSNFKNALFHSSSTNPKTYIKPHLEMIEFIVYQLILGRRHDLFDYNRLMEVLDGIRFLYDVCLPRDFIEIPAGVVLSLFNEHYKKRNLDYDFYGGDAISEFKVIPKDNDYTYDLVQERLPIIDFCRGQSDAYRELKKILLPEKDLIMFHIAGGWDDEDSYGISVGRLDLSNRAKKWVKKIKSRLEHLEFDKFHKILMKELRLFLVDDLSHEEKLKVLYYVLDYLIYERYPIEIRYIDDHIFHKKIKDYYRELNCSAKFDQLKDQNIIFTVYPEGRQFSYRTDVVNNNENNQVLQLFRQIFFPDEDLEILNIFKIIKYVFYVTKL